MHHAISLWLQTVNDAVLLCDRRQQNLEELGVLDARDYPRVSLVVQAVASVVDCVVHAECCGEMDGFHKSRDPLCNGHVASQVVSRLVQNSGDVAGEDAE